MVTLTVSVITDISGSVVVIPTLKNSSISIVLSSSIGTLPQGLEIFSSKVRIVEVVE